MEKRKKRAVLSVLVSAGAVLLTAWLFFDFHRISLPLWCYIPIAVRNSGKEWKRAKKWELNLAFKDALVCLENSLAVGYSPESSIYESIKGLRQLHGEEHEICREFQRMQRQMELGKSMEEVFSEFGLRSEVADIFAVVKRTGGNLSEVLRQTGGVLQEKIELKRELHTTIAAKRMEFRVMCVVPYGILLYLRLCAPTMSAALYHNRFGMLFMWGVWLTYMGLKVLGEKIIRSEIGRLEG